MGLFGRARHKLRDVFGRFSRVDTATEDSILEQVEDEIADIRGEGLDDVYDVITENIDEPSAVYEFTVENNGAELFRLGWMSDGGDADATQAARDEFFDLMEAYDISRDEFDWDAWRDWYEGE